MSKIIKRLRIPLHGNERTEFVTKKGLLIAKGYVRVIDGGRGPYIEFRRDQISSTTFMCRKSAGGGSLKMRLGKMLTILSIVLWMPPISKYTVRNAQYLMPIIK